MRPYLRSSKGSVSILALWTVVLLAILSVGIGGAVQQKINVYQQLRGRERVRVIGDAAVKKIASQILSAPEAISDIATGAEWYHNRLGKDETFSFEKGSAQFIIEDENGKINLNTASPYVLSNLFRFAGGLDAASAEKLAAAVVDFRDSDDHVTSDQDGGSEAGIYSQNGVSYGPKNGNFEETCELLLVGGMSGSFYERMKKFVTVYGDGGININTCRREVLLALDIPGELADKILTVRAGADHVAGTADDRVFKRAADVEPDLAGIFPLADEDRIAWRHALTQNRIRVSAENFRIEGRARFFDPPRTSAFSCVYGLRDGIRYWAES